MRVGQELDFPGVEKSMDIITDAGDIIENNLNLINTKIEESVGRGGYVWSGESAEAYKRSWEELAEDIPEYIKYVRTQAKNIRDAAETSKSNDTAESGTVGA